MRPTRAEVDLAAIRHNIRQIRNHTGPATKLIAVVKANAYGHGALKVAKEVLASGADCLAVAIPEEGAELRAAGINVPIFILGLVLPEQAGLAVEHGLTATVGDMAGVKALDAAALQVGIRLPVALKVDTGMGRIGVNTDDSMALLDFIQSRSGLEVVGIFTHLATADAMDKGYANKQLDLFRTTAGGISLPYIAAANSATIIDLPHGHFNAVRPGIIIYGLPPSPEMHNSLDLKCAMQLKSKVVNVKLVPANTSISYGCTYTTQSATWIATLPVGYADGYKRSLSNKADVLIGGKRRKIVGRVCMDQLMVDIGPDCDVTVGDEAVLFGTQGDETITVTELADLIGTINYELVSTVSPRVPRVYLNESI